MVFGKSNIEFRLGIFIFVAAAILVIFILSIGGIKTWTASYRVNFIFDFVNGIKIGAPVRFAGVDVGGVKEIKFIFDPQEPKTKVKIIGWVKKEIKIPVDSAVWVNTLGLLGEKYIEIMPGKDYNKVVTPDQTLVGIDPIPIHEVTVLAKKIVDDLDESIVKIKNKEGTIGKLLYDDAIYKELEAFMQDIRKNPWKLLHRTKEKK
jgi:phospholipid/cholesterol/gamma-HCH transport system substrate-binding protein